MAVDDPAQRAPVLRRLLQELAAADWDVCPPAIAQQLHRSLRRQRDCADPYYALKQRMNSMAAALLPSVRATISHHAAPPLMAIRAAIAGNLLDAGAKTRLAPEELPQHLQRIWHQPLQGDPHALFAAAAQARSILYLADNAGEIVFDRLLLEALPLHAVTLAVRGAPVINDATRADAKAAGITDIVPVIDNGSDAPGTILEDCSPAFRDVFERADLVIAKGQGNYESLSVADKPVYFLFTVKCEMVAAHVGAPIGTMVIHRAS